MNRGDLPVGVTPPEDELHKRVTYLTRYPGITLEFSAHVGQNHARTKVTGVMQLRAERRIPEGASMGGGMNSLDFLAAADPADNVSMAKLDPASVIEAVARDPRLRAFTSHGRIEAMPARQSRRRLLLDKIAQAFEPGVRYSERRVSLFLGAIHADHAALRRYLVDEEFLSRSEGEYWRSGGTVLPSPADEPRA